MSLPPAVMTTRPYVDQASVWPESGRHILARYDADSVHVYQAYRNPIAQYCVENQKLGGPDFSYSRMSWIKPNFLWMMYRSGWASKDGQERVLAMRVRRSFFDELLLRAVSSSYDANQFSSEDEWRRAVADSDVRLQWDPDHDPRGRSLQRRAIQLGLRGSALTRYGREEVLAIHDITPFVREQASNLLRGLEHVFVPEERVYAPPPDAARRIGVD